MTEPYAPIGSTLNCSLCDRPLFRFLGDMESGDVLMAEKLEHAGDGTPAVSGEVIECPEHRYMRVVLVRPDGTRGHIS